MGSNPILLPRLSGGMTDAPQIDYLEVLSLSVKSGSIQNRRGYTVTLKPVWIY